jgi:hypothetical protein
LSPDKAAVENGLQLIKTSGDIPPQLAIERRDRGSGVDQHAAALVRASTDRSTISAMKTVMARFGGTVRSRRAIRSRIV